MILAIIITSFLVGFVLGEFWYHINGYWDDLERYLNVRDEIIIKKLKK